MRRFVFFSMFLTGILLFSNGAQAKSPSKLLVLDFEQQGRLAPGSGKTLATLLSSSLNPAQYFLYDPNITRPLLLRHGWYRTHTLSPALLSDLKKLGITMLLTGSVGRQYGTFSSNYRVVSMEGRILFSEVLPPVQSWIGLVSSLRYSVTLLMRRTAASNAQTAKKAVPFRKAAVAAKKKPATALKEFDTLVKDFKTVAGLFPLYIQEKDGKRSIYMELSDKQLNQIYLFSPTLEGGTGDSSLITFATLRTFPFVLVRQGNLVLMLEKNVRYRAHPKAAISRALGRSFTDSFHGSTRVLSQPHPKRKTFLVDFNSLFFKDLGGLAQWTVFRGRLFRRPLAFDRVHSDFGKIQNFPHNLEIELKAVVSNPGNSVAVPPGAGMKLVLRYSVSELPNTGYRPRLADDRVGHFLTLAKDYTHDNVFTRYVRYINRWHLEKKFPNQTISVPKQPIVFWLENAIPYRYRPAVKKGVLLWNKAFETAGFQDAIEVRQQPDNATFDMADIRYSSIRWFLANEAGFAQGPSRANPLTGQLYDADIRVSADMGMFLSQSFRLVVNPVRSWDAFGLDIMSTPGRKMNILRSLENALKHFDQLKARKHQHLDPSAQTTACDYSHGAMQQAALGWHLLQLRGALPDAAQERKFIDDFVIGVIAHEVGHTLGLRHNFKASTLHSYADLHNPKKTTAMGLTNSVMEYTPVNLALPGQPQGQYWQTTLGPYDHWAIEYAYKPLPQAKTVEAEKPYLNQIASRVAAHNLAYATDEDAMGILSPDPEALRWDLGKDPLVYFNTRSKLAFELWQRIEKKFGTPKFSYQRMRQAFGIALGTYIRAGLMTAKYVGGIYHRRDHIGDPGKRLPFEPVAAAQQRKALHFLIEKFFSPHSLPWSPSLLNKLAPSRHWDFTFSIWGMRVDYPIHQAMFMMQALPLYSIFHPLVLDRIQDTRLRVASGADYMRLSEMFEKVSQAIWVEVQSTPAAAAPTAAAPTTRKTTTDKSNLHVPSFRRNLQWYHLQLLALYTRFNLSTLADASNLARYQLKELRAKIAHALPHTTGETRAHLDRCLSRIDSVLKPTVISF